MHNFNLREELGEAQRQPTYRIFGWDYPRIAWGNGEGERDRTGSCGDCGASRGQLHLLGCDMERCPCCTCQVITCQCEYDLRSAPPNRYLPRRLTRDVLRDLLRRERSDAGRLLEESLAADDLPFLWDYPRRLTRDALREAGNEADGHTDVNFLKPEAIKFEAETEESSKRLLRVLGAVLQFQMHLAGQVFRFSDGQRAFFASAAQRVNEASTILSEVSQSLKHGPQFLEQTGGGSEGGDAAS